MTKIKGPKMIFKSKKQIEIAKTELNRIYFNLVSVHIFVKPKFEKLNQILQIENRSNVQPNAK